MPRAEEYSSIKLRNVVGWLHLPSKLPLVTGGKLLVVVGAFIMTIYVLSILYKQALRSTDVSKPSMIVSDKNNTTKLVTRETKGQADDPINPDLEVTDGSAAIQKWKMRALAAEARFEVSQTTKDEADSSRSKLCGNAKVTSCLLNSTAISELNDMLLAKWRKFDDPLERWMNAVTVFNNVWDKHLRQLKLVSLANRDENKYFVDFIKPPNECNIITLGVGYDSTAESNFLSRHPNCRFLAVDPQAQGNRALVEELRGLFVNAAVAGSAGVHTAYVWYEGFKNIDHMSFIDFMRRYNGEQVVDWLNMDVEKAELGILQTMHENSTLLPPICQFNVEIHYPPDREPIESITFVDLLEKIVQKGHYVPMHVELPSDDIIKMGYRYLRMFFLNVRDEVCVRKFVC